VQFGYVTLFAGAFPLASTISILCNFVEIRSDIFKTTFITRRPVPARAKNIGTWELVMTCQVWLAILTNTCVRWSRVCLRPPPPPFPVPRPPSPVPRPPSPVPRPHTRCTPVKWPLPC
jgi:hypothetical protein